jgi:Dyp-type peroxidase family
MASNETAPQELPLADLQGLIVRGYHMPHVRHFVLKIDQPAAAKRWIGSLVDGSGPLQITSAEAWPEKPGHCLNLGLTWDGLCGLAIPGLAFDDNFFSFKRGSIAQAAKVGDVGDSAPEHWGVLGQPGVHAILSLYTRSAAAREEQSAELRRLWDGAFSELASFDGDVLRGPDGKPSERIHFGYIDGIAQPTLQGGPRRMPDAQPPVPPYLVFLQDLPEAPYNLPQPREVGLNGSFGAFRILAQDVAGFEGFLRSQADKIDPELLAAKMCGRWRSGTPLALAPERDEPVPAHQLNDFDYVQVPAGTADPAGLHCPIGSHTRRTNPRSEQTVLKDQHNHRIIRRAMPYGPAYDPNHPDDGVERGLIGMFIAARLAETFEFLMTQWVNGSLFVPGLAVQSKDPLLGNNDPGSSVMEIPRAGGEPLQITGFPRFVKTRGSAYCFFPSLAAMRYIAGH